MKLKLYQIDAFAHKIFQGNPAAVCPLEKWPHDSLLLSIAQENNLSETAFYVKEENNFHIRWFTPKTEVKLCGHATLATAFVIFNIMDYKEKRIEFNSLSGILKVEKQNEWLIMDFPAQPPVVYDTPSEITEAFRVAPVECLKSHDYLVVFEREKDVASAEPDMEQLKRLKDSGVIITAQSKEYDFVSRFFAPHLGIPEDPVTGSAHTQLAPYWARKLGKKEFTARQLSSRGGELKCELRNDRVLIAGKAVKYMEAVIEV